ncbi:putative fungal zinc cluster transcription factor [Pseudozyma hubeiensis]|nr:putative fungal zinc cluster transcription factor [Pseudozyma hubeiensis]
MSPGDHASPSITSSTSFQSGLAMHTSPMLSRSSSTSGYSSQHHSRHTTHPAHHHHPYAPSSDRHPYPASLEHHRPGPQHRDFHPHRSVSLQRPMTPPSSSVHHPYYSPAHVAGQPHMSQQQFPPPPLSASAAADWDHTSQQHLYKRARYDDTASSASNTAVSPVYQDPRSRQPFEAHHRAVSNHSQTSSKGKARDTLPPISPVRPEAISMMASASLPAMNGASSPSHRVMASPKLAARSADTSPADRVSPAAANRQAHASPQNSHQPAWYPSPARKMNSNAPTPANADDTELDVPLSPSPRPSSGFAQPRQKLVFDYNSNDPNPEQFLSAIETLPHSIVTQPTKGAHAYFGFLQGIARLPQGQAMAHALAAVAASHQASGPVDSEEQGKHADVAKPRVDQSRTALAELANRHHLSAIKALQTQQQPSRRRRFSVIETNPNASAEELPAGSNAATMILLILACSSIGKSLMLPSYFNQCEQFLADAVEHVSAHRLFPSISGEAIVGTPEDPPTFSADNLTNYGGLLLLGTVVGLYECYLSQYTAITDWDYNPARLKRLLPFNWSESDALAFDQVRKSVSETTYSVSMVTIELVIETLDTMRRFKRAEASAYGNRQSSRSEAEDGAAALDSLALREELGLVIRDLEAGTFWKGASRILSEAEQQAVLDGSPSQTLGANADQQPRKDEDADPASDPVTQAFKSGSLFTPSASGEQKPTVNRLRLANHLYRNALLVDLYVTVFNRPATSRAVRDLVSRSIALLSAVPEKLEQGLMWPAIVLGSYAQDEAERAQVRSFIRQSQWKGTAGPSTASEVLERVWSQECCWRDSVSYFGSPYIS